MKRFWDLLWLFAAALVFAAVSLLHVGIENVKALPQLTTNDWQYVVTGEYP